MALDDEVANQNHNVRAQSGLDFVHGIMKELLELREQISQVAEKERQDRDEAVQDLEAALTRRFEMSDDRIQAVEKELGDAQSALKRRLVKQAAIFLQASADGEIKQAFSGWREAVRHSHQEQSFGRLKKLEVYLFGGVNRIDKHIDDVEKQTGEIDAHVKETEAHVKENEAHLRGVDRQLAAVARNERQLLAHEQLLEHRLEESSLTLMQRIQANLRRGLALQLRIEGLSKEVKGMSEAVNDRMDELKGDLGKRAKAEDHQVLAERVGSAEQALKESSAEHAKKERDLGQRAEDLDQRAEALGRRAEALEAQLKEVRADAARVQQSADAAREQLGRQLEDNKVAGEASLKLEREARLALAERLESSLETRVAACESRESEDAKRLAQQIELAEEKSRAAVQVVEHEVRELTGRVKRHSAHIAAQPPTEQVLETFTRIADIESAIGLVEPVSGLESFSPGAREPGSHAATGSCPGTPSRPGSPASGSRPICSVRRRADERGYPKGLDGARRCASQELPIVRRLHIAEVQMEDMWKLMDTKADAEDVLQRLSYKSDVGHTHDRLVSSDGVSTFVL